MYHTETEVWLTRGTAKRLKKYIGGCGFITHINEVDNTPIKKEDLFRVVCYHPDIKKGVEGIIKNSELLKWSEKQF